MTSGREFPAGFRWGTATAAHQIEGGCWNNDWWLWEHTPGSGCAEPSGDACDSWNRWPDDVAVLAELGFTDYRFSLEWSRIEPEDGELSIAALDHYARVCEGLLAAGIEPVVTFHHFTTPRWLAARGGWERPDTAARFASFCDVAATRLAGLMRRACTINEPNIVSTIGYLAGAFPPGKRDAGLRRKVNEVMVDAHRQAVDAIRAGAPGVPVGLTLSMTDYQAVDGGEAKRDQIRRGMEDVFLDATTGDDFIGVQTYSRNRIGPDGAVGAEDGVPTLIMGYEYYPQALEATIRRAWEVTKGEVPILVTENGIGTDDDDQRIAYVRTALEGVLACIADGIDVGGYTYWSLLDNFEWAYGYGPRFGIVECDRTTFARTPKASARWLGRVAQANALVD
ncbi:MAG: glycoside hydrolase family 1 protein [Acidimicrobiales bacterium]